MNKNIKVSILFDFYKNLLTYKQRNIIEQYYNNDLSLGEISEHLNITRQGVRDSVLRAERALFTLEDKLGLAEKFMYMRKELDKIYKDIECIKQLNDNEFLSDIISNKCEFIKGSLNNINEKL